MLVDTLVAILTRQLDTRLPVRLLGRGIWASWCKCLTRLPLPVGTPRICRPFAVPVIRAKGSAGFSPCSLGADRQSREISGCDSAGSLDTGASRLEQPRITLQVKQLESLVPCEQAPQGARHLIAWKLLRDAVFQCSQQAPSAAVPRPCFGR